MDGPETLAGLAVESAQTEARDSRDDGISYLMRAQAAGVRTPLSDSNERLILDLTGTESLEDAWESLGRDPEAGGA